MKPASSGDWQKNVERQCRPSSCHSSHAPQLGAAARRCMNKIEASQKLEEVAAVLEEVAASLDQTQTPCDHCGTKVRRDVVSYYAAIAIDGAQSRVRKAATNLRQAATQPSEED